MIAPLPNSGHTAPFHSAQIGFKTSYNQSLLTLIIALWYVVIDLYRSQKGHKGTK